MVALSGLILSLYLLIAMNEEGFRKIKKLVKTLGGKVIIVENGEPSFVISDVNEYLGFPVQKDSLNTEVELIEKINQDILEWKNRQRDRELSQMEKNLSSETEKVPERSHYLTDDRI